MPGALGLQQPANRLGVGGVGGVNAANALQFGRPGGQGMGFFFCVKRSCLCSYAEGGARMKRSCLLVRLYVHLCVCVCVFCAYRQAKSNNHVCHSVQHIVLLLLLLLYCSSYPPTPTHTHTHTHPPHTHPGEFSMHTEDFPPIGGAGRPGGQDANAMASRMTPQQQQQLRVCRV